MDKQNVVYTYNGILFSLKKKVNSTKCYNMDEHWGHFAKWNKPVTKYKYCTIPLVWGTPSSQIHKDRNCNGGPRVGRVKNGELLFKKYRASVLQDEKKYGDELWQWLHNNVYVFNTTEPYS